MRRGVQQLWIFGDDFFDRFGESVECCFRLGFGRLDHDRFRDDQREVDRRCVEAVVEQSLGNVHRRDAKFLLQVLSRSNELVHAAFAVWNWQDVLQLFLQIIRVEDGVL